MGVVTRKIGLSLGADICWPGCYEEIVQRLDLSLPKGRGETIRFEIERVTVEPFDLQQPCRYDVVLDRLTHWFHTSREWIKKAVILDGLYVLNNPWALQSMEKHTTYAAMMKLGLPVPRTFLVPPREHQPRTDLKPTLERYARQFDVGSVGREVGFPLFMKPYDGGAWEGVTRIDNEDELRRTYQQTGQRIMHLQAAVEPFDLFVRSVGVGPQVRHIRYDPTRPIHDRYQIDFFFLDAEEWSLLSDQLWTINAFFGWEFNSCESLRRDKVFHPIDFANACPDFQVTSLHYHFPELVKDMVRWSLFCAYSQRQMRVNLDWKPFFAVAKKDLPFRERLREYAKIALERMDSEPFAAFCQKHLGHLDEVLWEFFGTDRAHDLIREKVAAIFPPHEVTRFTAHYWGLVQFWRKTEADRLARLGLAVAPPPSEAPEKEVSADE
jgi:hypothetical protein